MLNGMTHAPLRSFCATTAICAVLALGTTPAWAQDAAPTLDVPAVSAPASPSVAAAPPRAQAPTIQLPAQTPAPAAPPSIVSQPMVETPAQAEPAAPPAKSPSVTPRQHPVASARKPAAAAATKAPVRATDTAELPAAEASPTASLPPAPPAAPPPAAAVLPAQAPAASTTDTVLNPTADLAALLLVLIVGSGAYLAIRARRRRRDDDVYDLEAAEAYDDPQAALAANEPTGGLVPEAPLPAFATVEDVAGEPVVRQPEPATVPAPERPSATLDEPVPQSRAARDALLEEMVAAPPDADNPFTSRKARMRRARIILQSREVDQREHATQPFDWRTYKPSTSAPAPATPPRVTA